MSTSVANRTRIKRFTPIQQLFHLLLIVTFLIQGATGLARMFIETFWAKPLLGCSVGTKPAALFTSMWES